MATAELEHEPQTWDAAYQWPQAKVRPAGAPFPEDQFITLPDVPVFAEHQTTARDGRTLRFTRVELEQVCERCNRRIRETGDYAAVTLGHTPEPGSGEPDPEVVGFAGPFRMGVLGEQGARQRWAILADFHVFRDRYSELRKHPRRSPELWLEDRYEEMFLDPIALLGAEAPRLDMGLLYFSRRADGRLVERYCAAAMPAVGNVSPRSDDLKKPYSSAQGSTLMLSPEDIRQIVDAIEQLDWVQAVKGQLAADQGSNASIPGGEAPPPAPAPEAPAPAPAGPPEAPPTPEAASPPPGHAAPGEPPSPAGGDAPPPIAPAADEEDKQKMAAATPKPNFPPKQYAAGEEEEVEININGEDEDEEDDFEDYGRQGRRRRRRYEASGSVDADNDAQPSRDASVDAPEGKPGGGSVADGGDEAASTFQTPGKAEKFSLSHARARIHKLESELAATQRQLGSERATRTDAERYAKLQTLRQQFVFDLGEEFERVKYGKLSDEQFARHVETVERNYRPIPVDTHLPMTEGSFEHVPGQPSLRAKYSRELSDKARLIAEQKAMRGEPVSYEAVLEALHAGTPIT